MSWRLFKQFREAEELRLLHSKPDAKIAPLVDLGIAVLRASKSLCQ